MPAFATQRLQGRVAIVAGAGAVAFLCSDDAGFVTGQVLAVDGGQTSSAFTSGDLVQCWVEAHSDSD